MATAFPLDSVIIEESTEDSRPKRKRTPKSYGEDYITGKLTKLMKDSDKTIQKTASWLKQKVLTPIKKKLSSKPEPQQSLIIDDSTSETPATSNVGLPNNTSTPIHDAIPTPEGGPCNESFHSLDGTILPEAETPLHNQKQSPTMDTTTNSTDKSVSLTQKDKTQQERNRSNSVPDLLFDKPLADLLADESQLALNSTAQGFKTLVSDSVQNQSSHPKTQHRNSGDAYLQQVLPTGW